MRQCPVDVRERDMNPLSRPGADEDLPGLNAEAAPGTVLGDEFTQYGVPSSGGVGDRASTMCELVRTCTITEALGGGSIEARGSASEGNHIVGTCVGDPGARMDQAGPKGGRGAIQA